MNHLIFNFISTSHKKYINPSIVNPQKYFNKNMNFYVCSFGGCGSTVIFNYLSHFGNVYHIHDRYPPNKLTYVGNENTKEDVYREWFNSVPIPEDKLQNYKVIYIYRNPLQVIYSRFVQAHGPNINHLKNIKCINNGNIHIYDVLKIGRDLYKMEEFYDNYVSNKERNYNIYCVKYEMFWNNISIFNKVLGIPDIKYLYPEKRERLKQILFQKQLNQIYRSLILKMNTMRFIELIPKKINEVKPTNEIKPTNEVNPTNEINPTNEVNQK
jgi:hypothetical protein